MSSKQKSNQNKNRTFIKLLIPATALIILFSCLILVHQNYLSTTFEQPVETISDLKKYNIPIATAFFVDSSNPSFVFYCEKPNFLLVGLNPARVAFAFDIRGFYTAKTQNSPNDAVFWIKYEDQLRKTLVRGSIDNLLSVDPSELSSVCREEIEKLRLDP
jgi:hypothetical protein